MTDTPKRVQLRRTKGWRKPEGAVVVSRPSKWGNPFTVAGARNAGFTGSQAELNARCAGMFGNAMLRGLPVVAWHLEHISELRGKDLLCWCALDQPCHADTLLDLANG